MMLVLHACEPLHAKNALVVAQRPAQGACTDDGGRIFVGHSFFHAALKYFWYVVNCFDLPSRN